MFSRRVLKKNVSIRFYGYKNFVFPSGKVVRIQGYENFAIRDLLNDGVPEEAIITGKKLIPVIPYKFEGNNRLYYPDIYIPSKNLIIEVKSLYTFHIQYSKNIHKFDTTLCHGFLIWIWIYNNNGKRTQEYKYRSLKMI